MASRFKKRGKRFIEDGTHFPAKVVEERLNGALSGFIREGVYKKEVEKKRKEW